MRVDRTLRRIQESTGECSSLSRASRDIGHELHRDRIGVLSELSSGLALELLEADEDFARGYKAALHDVVSAYLVGAKSRSAVTSAGDWVSGRRWAMAAAEECRGVPRTVSEVADSLGISVATASRVLSGLRDIGVVENLPRRDGRSRASMLTMFGETVISTVGKPANPAKS